MSQVLSVYHSLESKSDDRNRDYLVAALLFTFCCALICLAADVFGISEAVPLTGGIYIIAIGSLIVAHGLSKFKSCREEAELVRCNPFWSTNAEGQITLGENPLNFNESAAKRLYSIGSLYIVEMIGGLICWLAGLVWLAVVLGLVN